MDTAVYAAIMGAVVGGSITALAGILTGLILYKLEGRRLERQWEREDRLRTEEQRREAVVREMEILLEQKKHARERLANLRAEGGAIRTSEHMDDAWLELQIKQIDDDLRRLASALGEQEPEL